jgi:hypothetical protein
MTGKSVAVLPLEAEESGRRDDDGGEKENYPPMKTSWAGGKNYPKKKKRDINYSREQEQQIPIKNDWQMPSCFKCLLRLVIAIVFCLSPRQEREKFFNPADILLMITR